MIKVGELRLGPLGSTNDLTIAAQELANKENEVIRALIELAARKITWGEVDEKPQVFPPDLSLIPATMPIDNILWINIEGKPVNLTEFGLINEVRTIVTARLLDAISSHNNDSTDVHGIPDTSLLETQAGAQARVNTALDFVSDELANYLLKTGGTISGDLQVNGTFRVGNDLPVPVAASLNTPVQFSSGNYGTEGTVVSMIDGAGYGYAGWNYSFVFDGSDEVIQLLGSGCEVPDGTLTSRQWYLYDWAAFNYLMKMENNGRLTIVGDNPRLDMGDLPALSNLGDGILRLAPATVTGALNVTGDLTAASFPWASLTGVPSTFAPSSHSHPHTDVTDWNEGVDDRVAALLQAGANVTITYNDSLNTLTIAGATPGITQATADTRYLQLAAGGNVAGATQFSGDASFGRSAVGGGGGWNLSGNMRALFLPLLTDPAYSPRISMGVYNSTTLSDWTERFRMGIARSANEGVTGTSTGDAFISVTSALVMDPITLTAGQGLGVNGAPSSETLRLVGKSQFHTVLSVYPKQGTAPGNDVVIFHNHSAGITLRQRSTYDWELLRGNLVLGDVVENLAPGVPEWSVGLRNTTDPTSSPIGGCNLRAKSGRAVVRNSDGTELDSRRLAAIADADGTLLDLTTKFNTLLAGLRTCGRLAT